MGLLDRWNTTPASQALDFAALEARLQDVEDENRYLNAEVREAREDLLKVADAFDSVGWAPLDSKNAKEIDLATVKRAANVSRALYAMNPFVQSGVNARIGYIWGRGVVFDGVESINDKIEDNRRKLFNDSAYTELERVLATDGNSFTALPTGDADEDSLAFRVPLDQIMSAVSNPDDVEDVWYYRREWSVKLTNSQTGDQREVTKIKYYPSLEYYQRLQKAGKNLPRRWKDAGVEQNYVIHHVAVNRQIGWRWGVPDVLPVIFWAKAYKEYLEDNATLVKAYSRIAWQIQAGSVGGAQAAGAQVMAPPTRDPMTGELQYVGSTVVTGPGTVASAMPATGSQVDFSKGSAMASAIAAGLQVPKTVITRDPGEGNRSTAETLDLPTLKAMESRQLLHTDRFLQLFEFWGAKVTPVVQSSRKRSEPNSKEAEEAESGTGPEFALVTWPQIESDSTKDRIAALGTAAELGVLYKQEARKDALGTLGIAPYKPWDELPTMEDDPAAKEQFEREQMNAEREFQQQQVIAKQGVSGGVAAKGGAQSTPNSARNNRKADSKSK